MGLFKKKGKVLCHWDYDLLKAWNKRHNNKQGNKHNLIKMYYPVGSTFFYAAVSFKRQKAINMILGFREITNRCNEEEGAEVTNQTIVATKMSQTVWNASKELVWISGDPYVEVAHPTTATEKWDGVSPMANALEGVAQDIIEFAHWQDEYDYNNDSEWANCLEDVIKSRRQKGLTTLIIGAILAVVDFIVMCIPAIGNWRALAFALCFIGIIVLLVGLYFFLSAKSKKKALDKFRKS